MGECAKAIKDGQNVPEDSQENQILAHDVAFNEATTESVQQMSLNYMILREYGVAYSNLSRFIQLGSLGISTISIVVSFTKVLVKL